MTGLRSYDRDAWAAAFSAAAAPYQSDAEDAEQNGDTASARRNYLRAYGYYRLARYPTTNSDAKLAAYRQSQELLLRAARYLKLARDEGYKEFRAAEKDPDFATVIKDPRVQEVLQVQPAYASEPQKPVTN